MTTSRWIFLFILFMADTAMGASAAVTQTAVICQRKLIAVNSGTYVPISELPEALRELAIYEGHQNYTFSLLGSGITAKAYLVSDESGKPLFVYKVYHEITGREASPPEVLKLSDETAFEEIQSAIDKGIDVGFKIPKTYNVFDSLVSKLEYVPGRDLASILQDESVSKALKTELLAIYKRKLDKFTKNFMTRLPTFDVEAKDYTYKAQALTSDGSFLITIKPSNVIVDPVTFQMTLIDPN